MNLPDSHMFIQYWCVIFFVDLYQINMAYAYWKAGKTNDHAVFDLFFRKNPFQGEFTIFAGLEQCIKFLDNFRYTDSGELMMMRKIIKYEY